MFKNYFRRKAIKLVLRLIGLLLEALVVSLEIFCLLELITPPPQVGKVQGNLTYGDASQLGGVTLTLVKGDVTSASTTSKEDGTFEFEPIAIGAYVLKAHKDLPVGYLEASVDIDVEGDMTVADLLLVTDFKYCEPGTR